MMRQRRSMGRFLAVMGFLLAWLAGSKQADAGQGTYDPKAREFRLTYTYALVPNLSMTPDQVDGLGQVQEVSHAQDAKVRALFAAVSEKLWQATDKRGKLGSFDHVDNVKQADIIISPTGKVGRGGYATPGAIEGRQGHLVLFYEELMDEQETDEQLTVLHELCHYLFALPDEYRDGETQGLCPLKNLGGPGCLMDNYLFYGPRHGWYGRFCDDDHNAAAPNIMTVISGQSPKQSCKNLIDLFFQSRLKGDDALNPPSDDASDQPTSDDPFTGIFKSLVESTSSVLKNDIEKAKEAKKPIPTASSLKTRAERFLRDQIAFGKQGSSSLKPTPDQIKRGVEFALKVATTARLTLPERIDKTAADTILQKAKELAAQELGKRKSSTSRTASSKPISSDTVQRAIMRELESFAKDILGLNDKDMSSDKRAFSPTEKAFLTQTAADAATQVTEGDTTELGKLYKAAQLHIKLSQIIARNTLDAADDQGIVGTDIRRLALTETERDLEKLALKGNPFQGFGLRRTAIFAPMPVDPKYDNIHVQAGNTFTYWDYRRIAVAEFASLIVRERIILVPEDMTPPLPVDFGKLDPADRKKLDTAERRRLILRQIEFLNDQVRRNRVDNIIVCVPPGGLPENLGDQLETLRKRMILNPDVRLDIVEVGPFGVPERLRDLSFRSAGSTLLVTDIDEIGAAAQRLRGEGISGSWVIIPEQGRLDLTPTPNLNPALPAPIKPKESDLGSRRAPREVPIRTIRDRLHLLAEADFPWPPVDGSSMLDQKQQYDESVRRDKATRTGKDKERDLDAADEVLTTLGFLKKQANVDSVDSWISKPEGDDKARVQEEAGKLEDWFGRRRFAPVSLPPFSRGEAEGDAVWKGRPLWYLKLAVIFPNLVFPRPPQIASGPGQAAVKPAPTLMSLAMMRKDFESLGSSTANIFYQEQIKVPIRPILTNIDTLIQRLDALDKALQSISPRDSDGIRAAFQLTIESMHDVAFLVPPSGRTDGLVSTEDVLYRSRTMRGAIEKAILKKLKRFEDTKKAYQTAIEVAANQVDGLDVNAAQHKAKDIEAYDELIRLFSQIYQNLRQYDAIEPGADGPQDISRTSDPFPTLALALADPSPLRGGEVPQMAAFASGLAAPQAMVSPPPSVETARTPVPSSPNPAPSPVTSGPPIAPPAPAQGIEPPASCPQAPSNRDDTPQSPPAMPPAGQAPPMLPPPGQIAAPAPVMGPAPPAPAAPFRAPIAVPASRVTGADDFEKLGHEIEQPQVSRLVVLLAEIYLELLDLKHELNRGPSVSPAFDRFARTEMSIVPAATTGEAKLAKEETNKIVLKLLADAPKSPSEPIDYKLKPFTAEENADFDLIVGFSRPLNLEAIKQEAPMLKLFLDDKNQAGTPFLKLDEDKTTSTMLVYRLPNPNRNAGRISTGDYQPRLYLKQKHLPNRGGEIDYTFSVATANPKILLTASLRQVEIRAEAGSAENDSEIAFRGILPTSKSEAIIEALVVAGTSVQNVDVTGFYQKIDASGEMVESPALTFLDDGRFPDTTKGDGVYTAKITLDPQEVRKKADYRVMIEARSNDRTAFVPPAENFGRPGQPSGAIKASTENASPLPDPTTLPSVPRFQRATSLNFQVQGQP